MNIITRKKEIMEVIEKLNEAIKLANGALAGLEEFEKLEKKTKTIKATSMFNKNSVAIIGGVEYVKTNAKPKNGDYVVFNKEVPNRTKKDVIYPVIGVDKFYVEDDYATFTKKSLTRKEVINKAVDYLYDYYYVGGGVNPSCYVVNGEECSMYLTHNAVKRTSNLVLRGTVSKKVRHHQTIRCHPDDVYNETIGAAILIARLRNDSKMVELFENAPQPTEIKEGMYIDILVDNVFVHEKDFLVRHYDDKKDIVQGSDRHGQHDRKIGGIKYDGFVIKDDLDVIY